jgi:signal transduction histidine kinase
MSSRLSSSSTEREQPSGINLWEYLSRLSELSGAAELKTENIFKLSRPEKRFIQVKTQMINGGTQLIAVFTDITAIKNVEKQGKLLRSHFFTSIAHELRTPLNSIIPVIKMII